MSKPKMTACMSLVTQMDEQDQDMLLDRLALYQKDGIPPERAQLMAASDTLAELENERKEFMALLREQHPDLFLVKPEPAKSKAEIKASKGRENVETIYNFREFKAKAKSAGLKLSEKQKLAGTLRGQDAYQYMAYDPAAADPNEFGVSGGMFTTGEGWNIGTLTTYSAESGSERSAEFARITAFNDLALRKASANIRVSAASAFADEPFTIQPGVREVPLSQVEMQDTEFLRSAPEQKRIADLADAIKKSGSIEPLFVAQRADGSRYVAEGNHRARALRQLGYSSIPARIMVESAGNITKSPSRVAEKWKEYSQDPSGFKLGNTPSMQSKDVEEIAKAFSGEGVTLTAPLSQRFNGGFTLVVNGDPDNGEMTLLPSGENFRIEATGARGFNGRQGADAGQRMYQAILAYAHNNDIVIVPSSDMSPINGLRRTSTQLSSALRFGTTDFMSGPHKDQGVDGWRDGDFDGNISALAMAEMRNVLSIGDLDERYRILPDGNVERVGVLSGEPLDQGSGRIESRAGGGGDLQQTPNLGSRGNAGGQDDVRRGDGNSSRNGNGQAGAGESDRGAVAGVGQAVVSDAKIKDHLASIGGGIGKHGVGVATLKRALVTKAWLNGEDMSPQKSLLYSPQRNALGFYSALTKGIEDMPTKQAPAGAWQAQIKGLVNKGVVKADELEWSGLNDWLDLQIGPQTHVVDVAMLSSKDKEPKGFGVYKNGEEEDGEAVAVFPTEDEARNYLGNGKVPKEAIAEYLQGNGVQVQETVLGVAGMDPNYQEEMRELQDLRRRANEGDEGVIEQDELDRLDKLEQMAGEQQPTKYGQYTLPGGENYREVLLTLPGKSATVARYAQLKGITESEAIADRTGFKAWKAENEGVDYQSSHWDQKNILAHLRLNDRTDADGGKVLFVEEIQSDFGQDAKKKGIQKSPDVSSLIREMSKEELKRLGVKSGVLMLNNGTWGYMPSRTEAEDYLISMTPKSGVPNAPFIDKTEKWLSLALKRVMILAAEGGYDKVAFINGQQSAERYSLGGKIDTLLFDPGDGRVIGRKNGGNIVTKTVNNSSEIADIVGKEVAERLLASPQNGYGMHEISGLDLEVGGEGMKFFYDQIVPQAIKKLLPKVGGGQMGSVTVNQTDGFSGNAIKAPAKGIQSVQTGFDVTPAMRDKVAGGLPLFSRQRQTDTPEFKRWSNDAPLVKLGDKHSFRSGEPVVVEALHGTTNANLNEFLRQRASITSDFGAGFYASNSPDDVATNYANVDGPDLTHRVELLAERMQQDDEFEGDSDEALRLARAQLSDSAPNTLKLFIRFKNPAVLGGKGETYFDYSEEYNEDTDEYGEPTGMLVDFVNALDEAGDGIDVSTRDIESTKAKIFEAAEGDGLKFGELARIVKDNMLDASSLEDGSSAGSEMLRQALAEMGFDGVIDSTVNDKFGPKVIRAGQAYDRAGGMKGMTKDTTHFIAFESNQLKSATGNNGDFSLEKNDITKSAARQTETPAFKKWFGDSKVVDAEGKPLVVYHGTGEGGSTEFSRNSWKTAYGHFFTDDKSAADYYTYGKNPQIYAVYLKMENPLRLDQLVEDGYGKPTALQEWVEDTFDPEYGDAGEQFNEWLSGADLYSRDEGRTQDDLMAWAEENDYDGVVFFDAKGGGGVAKSFVAFESAQIKSATGNNGAFDSANPDITKSTGRTSTGADWDSPSASKFDDMVYKIQDKTVDLKRVVASIREASGAIADDLDTYLQEELYHGRTAKRTEDFVNMELTPLIEEMGKQGLTIADVEEYLHARHAPEANKVIAQRNPGAANLQDGGSGMTTQVALDYITTLPADLKLKLEAAAAKVDAITKKTNQLYIDYELESKDKIDGWGKMFQHYIPLQREDKDGSPGLGQGFSIKGKEVKGRTGSTRKVVDILANIAIRREKAIVRGEKNRVSQSLVGLAKSNPNEDFWQVDVIPTERVFNPDTGLVEDRVDPLYKSRDNAVIAKIKDGNGIVREHAVLFNEEDPRALRMAKTLKNLDVQALEGIMGVSAKISRYFAAINTQLNPVFGVVNLVRDVQGALLNLSSTPLKGDERKIAKYTASALKGVYFDARAARKGNTPTSAWSQLWDEFQMVGGQTGYRDLFNNSAERAEAIQKALNPDTWMDSRLGKIFTAGGALKVPLSEAKKGAGWIFNWISDYNLAMENGVRLAAYKAGLERGMSKEQAASAAKNLTVNFNRKGQASQHAGALYAFFNASVQGTARIFETVFTMEPGQPKTIRLSPVGKKIVYGGMMLGSMQAMALAAAGFNDEDPPEFVRERSLIIPLPNNKYITIPMPLGYHVLPGLGRISTEFVLSGFKDPHKRALSVANLFVDTFNPIGNAGLSMQTLAPTALDPLVALTENKDYTGKPIARESSNNAIPGHTLGRDTATTIAKLMSEGINTLSGGNKYTSGVFSPTPDQIDYLIGQLTGGVGRELSKVEQSVLSTARGEELPTYKIPLVGRFVGDAKSQASEGTAFYANADRLNRLETEIKGLQKDGKTAEASELRRSSSEAYLITMANQAERQIQKLRAEKRELIKKDAPREQVKAIEERVTEVMARLNRASESLKERAQ